MPYLSWKELKTTKRQESSFDFIIVAKDGAGSWSGFPLASRLSEDLSVTVLLVVLADGDGKASPTTTTTTASSIPVRAAGAASGTKGPTMHSTTTTRLMNMYCRGHASDYNNWERHYGAKGWNYDDTIRPLFEERIEDTSECIPQLLCAKCRRRHSTTRGPLGISHKTPPSSLVVAFLSSAKQLGFLPGDYNCNCNCNCHDSNKGGVVSLHQQTVRQGTRCTVARAYLEPILIRQGRPNVYVLKDVKCQQILWESKTNNDNNNPQQQQQQDKLLLRATGIELVGADDNIKEESTKLQIHCTKEVILSAGALETPRILLQSGIGGSTGSVLQSPLVGQHLQCHMSVALPCRVSQHHGSSSTTFQKELELANNAIRGHENWFEVASNVLSMLLYHAGIYTSSTYDASIIFYNDSTATEDENYPNNNSSKQRRPDAQISLVGSSLYSTDKDSNTTFYLRCTLLHPQGKGSIEWNSDHNSNDNNITSKMPPFPKVRAPKYTRSDVQCMARILQTAHALTTVGPLAANNAVTVVLPQELLDQHHGFSNNNSSNATTSGDNNKNNVTPNDAFWEDYVDWFYHQEMTPSDEASRGDEVDEDAVVGTCRMGTDPATGVVDCQLRVFGVQNLRIADASIQPEIVSSDSIMGSCVVIGERAADLIRNEYNLQSNPHSLLEAVDKYEGRIYRNRVIGVVCAVTAFSLFVAELVTIGFWKYQHPDLSVWDLFFLGDYDEQNGICEEPSRNSMVMFPA